MLTVLLPALVLAASAPNLGVLHQYGSLALSADGQRIASVETIRRPFATSEEHGAVVVRSASGEVLARLDPCGNCRYSGVAWSPRGQQLAFVGSADGKAVLYGAMPDAIHKSGFVAHSIAEIKGLLATPRWSPDSMTLAVLATAGAHKETGATQAGAREVGEIGQSEDFQRIALVDAAGGKLRYVSPDGMFVYEYGWMPDGRGFVGMAALGNGDDNWWIAKLLSFTLDGATHVLSAPAMQMNFPRVSPDGRSVAFIGGLMSDFGSVGGDIYVVNLRSTQVGDVAVSPLDVTPGFKGSFTSIAWRGNQLIASVVIGGRMGTALVDPRRRSVGDIQLRAATYEAADGAIALDGKGRHAAVVSESFDQPPRIEYGSPGQFTPVSHDNDALPTATVARDIAWRSEEFSVQGWLLSPVSVQPGLKYPMIMVVHGGPAAVVTPHFLWDEMTAGWLRNGYFVFQPNPRGSFGQGEAFTRANVRDFGGGDLRDDLAGIAAAEQAAPIDDARLGLYGRSYGGFMTMWIVTHSQRFKVAAAGAGIADWMAYYGQNGIDQWMIPYFGASAYDDPGIYDRLSPIRSIKAVHTPVFLYVGERDVECPAEQTREFWHGLREVGAPTSLVVYADEGHHLKKPENVADLNRRLVVWFDRYLK